MSCSVSSTLPVLHVLGVDEEDVLEDAELLEQGCAHEPVEIRAGDEAVRAMQGEARNLGHVRFLVRPRKTLSGNGRRFDETVRSRGRGRARPSAPPGPPRPGVSGPSVAIETDSAAVATPGARVEHRRGDAPQAERGLLAVERELLGADGVQLVTQHGDVGDRVGRERGQRRRGGEKRAPAVRRRTRAAPCRARCSAAPSARPGATAWRRAGGRR